MNLSDRVAKLEMGSAQGPSLDQISAASQLLARCAAYKLGRAIAELAGLPEDDITAPEEPDERAAAAVRGSAGDVADARAKLMRGLLKLSIVTLFWQCAQAYTGTRLEREVSTGTAMDRETAEAFVALLTDAEAVALSWCWAFLARPEQLLPA